MVFQKALFKMANTFVVFLNLNSKKCPRCLLKFSLVLDRKKLLFSSFNEGKKFGLINAVNYKTEVQRTIAVTLVKIFKAPAFYISRFKVFGKRLTII
jgi:hypothetical protein